MSEVGGAKRAEYGKLARYTAARSRSVIIVVVGRHTQRFTLFFCIITLTQRRLSNTRSQDAGGEGGK